MSVAIAWLRGRPRATVRGKKGLVSSYDIRSGLSLICHVTHDYTYNDSHHADEVTVIIWFM